MSRERPGAGRRSLVCIAGAVALFVATTLWLTRPLAWQAADHVREVCDTYIVTWVLAWDLHALTSASTRLFDANIFHPLRSTLALSEHMLGNLPIFAPVMWATGNPILGVNAVILASFVLTGLTTSWLAYHYTRRPGPSLVAGMVLAFVPYRFSQLYHAQLLSLQWLPLAVYFGDRCLREGGVRPWLGFTLFTLWQCLVSYYLAYLTAAVLGTYLVILAWWLRGSITLRRLATTVAALAIVAGVMLPLTWPYLRMQQRGIIPEHASEEVLRRDPTAVVLADPVWSWLSIPADSKGVYHGILVDAAATHPWEKTLFPGFLPVVLIGAALLRPPPRGGSERALPRGVVPALLGVAVVCYLLALGPWLTWNDTRTSLRLPAYWLSQLVPGLSGIRAWPRFGLGTLLAVGTLAALAVARLIADRRRWVQAVVTAGVLTGLVVEYDMGRLQLEPAAERATPAHAWLAEHGRGRPLLVLPTGYVHPCVHARYMYQSTTHFLPLLSGHSGHIPMRFQEVNDMAPRLPSPEALAWARRRGVRWLLLETEMLSGEQRKAFERAEANEWLEPALELDGEVIYDLSPGRVAGTPP